MQIDNQTLLYYIRVRVEFSANDTFHMGALFAEGLELTGIIRQSVKALRA